MSTNDIIWTLLASVLLLIGAFGLSACDTAETQAVANTIDNEELLALSVELAESVPLSEAGQQSVNSVLADNEPRVMEPGFLWYVAAGLQKTLSDEQKERMFALLDRIEKRRWREFRSNGIRDHFANRHNVIRIMLRPIADDLTDDQMDRLKEIHKSYTDQIKAVYQSLKNEEIGREEAHEQVAALRDAMKEEIDGVLTEEQKAELETFVQERKAAREEHLAAQREAMIDALDLSDEQVEALDELLEERKDVLGEWRGGFWEDDFDRQEFFEERLEIWNEMEAELAEILNGDQLEAFKIHRVLVNKRRGVSERIGRRSGQDEANGPAIMRRGGRR